MAELAALAIRLCVMILLLGAFEQLAPAGGLQKTVQTGFGLAFVSYTVTEIVGIIGRLGV